MLDWEKVLYPNFVATIKGKYYNLIDKDLLIEELYNLAQRAISDFLFPNISLAYTTEIDENEIHHGFFVEDNITFKEINVIISFMLYHWAENNIASSDNFAEEYTDASITKFSKGSAINNWVKLVNYFYQQALSARYNYSRINADGSPSLSSICDI